MLIESGLADSRSAAARRRHRGDRRRLHPRERQGHRRHDRSRRDRRARRRRARRPRLPEAVGGAHDADGPAARREAAAPRLRGAARRADDAGGGAVRGDVDRHPAAAAGRTVRPGPRHQAARAVDARAALLRHELRRLHRATHERRGRISVDRDCWAAWCRRRA